MRYGDNCDNTMREGKLWAFLHDSIHEAYKKLSTTGTSSEYHALLDSIASKVADDVDARFLQVAQSAQSVPVVGEPIYWIDPDDDANLSSIGRVGWSPLYGESPASTPAADLATLLRAAKAAIEQAARTVPEGYVMVPVEPTTEMLKKSGLYDDDTIEVNCAASMAGQIYRAMLAAAPKKEGEK